jgi:hypothetical protein
MSLEIRLELILGCSFDVCHSFSQIAFSPLSGTERDMKLPKRLLGNFHTCLLCGYK